MYVIILLIAIFCFGFHTAVHILEHMKKLSGNKNIFTAIGITMFFGWFSYGLLAFSGIDPIPVNLSGLNFSGLGLFFIGLYLFLASHKLVHKKMYTGKGKLITSGLYKHIRHPMYVGEMMMILGMPIFGQALLTLLISPLFIVQILIFLPIKIP